LSKLFTRNGNVTTRVPRSVRVGPDVFAPSAPVSDRDGETFHQLLHISQVDRHELLLLRVCLSCALLFVGWPQAASPLLRILQPAPHDPMVRSAFVSHNNKGRQRVYIDSHYLDNIDNNAVIINVHLCSHSEHSLS
jgi:hypothetical protein